jgi:hypothetical protein
VQIYSDAERSTLNSSRPRSQIRSAPSWSGLQQLIKDHWPNLGNVWARSGTKDHLQRSCRLEDKGRVRNPRRRPEISQQCHE